MSLHWETQPPHLKHRVIISTYIFCLAHKLSTNMCTIHIAFNKPFFNKYLRYFTSNHFYTAFMPFLSVSLVHTHSRLHQTADCQNFFASCWSALFDTLYSNSRLVPLGIAVEIITHGSWPFTYLPVQVIPTKAGKHVQEQTDDLCNWLTEAQEILRRFHLINWTVLPGPYSLTFSLI